MKFVLDNYVLLNAVLLSDFNYQYCFQKALKNGVILSSDELVEDIKKILYHKEFDSFVSFSKRETFVKKLEQVSLKVNTISLKKDKKANENKYLELAVSGNADYIITEDKSLLELSPILNIAILSPEGFVSLNLNK